jgi:hypothetical protein
MHGASGMLTHRDEEVWRISRRHVAPVYSPRNIE